VIIVKEAQDLSRTISQLLPYVENPSQTTILVLCYKYGKIDGKTKLAKELKKYVCLESKKLYESETLKWVDSYLKGFGYSIEPVAAQLLINFLGTDLSRIANELNKLKIILPKGTKITPLHIEQNIGISKDFNVFELQNALGKKDFAKAMQIIKYFNENQKDNPIAMITENLYRYFKNLFIFATNTSKGENELARMMGVNPYFLKDYRQAAANYPLKKISFCMETVKNADLKSKGVESGSISYYDILKEMIIMTIS
jgi:DNA polymerase III, delta subunit